MGRDGTPRDVRAELVAAAARRLAEGGPAAVSVRRVAADVGMSSMAVYTHFGSKTELLQAVSDDGFVNLARRMAEVPDDGDPIARLAALGRAYRLAAHDDPHRFAVMFTRPPGDVDGSDEALRAAATFTTLVDAVESAVTAGRIRTDAPASSLAIELWAAVHGLVALELGGGIPVGEGPRVLASLQRRLVVGAGDEPDRTIASIPDP